MCFCHRAATRHSQAASKAFLRGDHATAKELSLKAQEERAAAEKLNNKAAEEIFRLRNSNNDIWKMDMHGLHASEAVAILERHLHMIEFQPLGTSVASSDALAKFEAACSESTTDSNIEFANDKVVLRRPKQAILHVITGISCSSMCYDREEFMVTYRALIVYFHNALYRYWQPQ